MANNNFEIRIGEDNVDEILSASEESIEMALEAIGAKAVGYAILKCPVQTGRLRNSLVWATHGSDGSQGGNTQPGEEASEEDMEARATPDKNSVVIGTNVEYAEQVELGINRKVAKPYINPALQNHLDEYKSMIETMLKE